MTLSIVCRTPLDNDGTRSNARNGVSFMSTLRADEVKARWYEWAQDELGGSPERLDAIANAALMAAAEGLDTANVIRAARDAASAYDAQKLVPPVSDESSLTPSNRLKLYERRLRAIRIALFVLVLVAGAAWIATQHSHPHRHVIRVINIGPR